MAELIAYLEFGIGNDVVNFRVVDPDEHVDLGRFVEAIDLQDLFGDRWLRSLAGRWEKHWYTWYNQYSYDESSHIKHFDNFFKKAG